MREINLLESFPNAKRKIEKGWRTEKNKKIAKRFDKDFFDGDRINGYGGYYYDGRWQGIAKRLQGLYNLNSTSSVLDIGCAKGFLLYDLQTIIPGIKVAGIDISEYAINHAMDGYGRYKVKNGYLNRLKEDRLSEEVIEEIARGKVLPHMIKGSAEKLPWADNTFDVVLSINTTHNLPKKQFEKAIEEMIRVGKDKKKMFIQLDSYKTKEDEDRMKWWGLTCLTTMYTDEWMNFLSKIGYDGDCYWTIV